MEASVSHALPLAVPAPALRLFDEVDGWVVLGFEAVHGRPAREPWDGAELEAALAALDVGARLLTPAPLTGVPTVAQRMAGRCETWRALRRSGWYDALELSDLGPWERDHLGALADLEEQWADGVKGGALLHFDLRHDNCIMKPDATAEFVDWGRASRRSSRPLISAAASGRRSKQPSGGSRSAGPERLERRFGLC